MVIRTGEETKPTLSVKSCRPASDMFAISELYEDWCV